MDKALTGLPSIDSTPYVWMPLSHLTARIGALVSLPHVSTKFKPASTVPDEEEELKREGFAFVAGLTRIMIWVIGISSADDNKRILRARFLRTIVVLWFIDPHHFACASQASMARQYGFDKQSFNACVASFRKTFDYMDIRFRSPTAVAQMRKPSRE